MSRAFVRESDSPQPPERPPLASPLPPGARNLLTPGGARRLQAEVERLLATRPALATAPIDDLEARRELQLLDQRLRYLQDSLRTAEITAAPAGAADTVRFGATVTVREAGGAATRYRIVGVDEADANRNWVSWLSPLARALLGGRLGGRVILKAPRGARELEIAGIEFEE